MDQVKEQPPEQITTPLPEAGIVDQRLSSEQDYPRDYEIASRQPSNNNIIYLIVALVFLIFLSIASLFLTGIIKF